MVPDKDAKIAGKVQFTLKVYLVKIVRSITTRVFFKSTSYDSNTVITFTIWREAFITQLNS